jgi:S-DNA-T family DNA segregation ATPase FtsK/SpoIIIE
MSTATTTGYQFFDLKVSLPTKIADLNRYRKDIGLALGNSNINMNVMADKKIVRLELFNEMKPENLMDVKCAVHMHTLDQVSYKGATYPIVLGKTFNNEYLDLDIKDSNHILIGGATGAGKTVLLKSIINQLLDYRVRRDAVIDIIDTKCVDYQYLRGVENVRLFNSVDNANKCLDYYLAKLEALKLGAPRLLQFLIIDELADLIISAKHSVIYDKLLKLIQQCRAFGIYVIAATQRPSADIVDGKIKANFPTRIALRTASAIDSRVILDCAGAELLKNKGEAIIRSPSHNNVHFQGFYL